MPTDAPPAPAVRSETAAPYAACAGAPPPSAETLIARIERAGPAALDDHELLGLVGIHIDAATLAAAGGLRELLDDPDDVDRRRMLTPHSHAISTVCRGKAPSLSGCESRPATVAPAGSNRSGRWR